jgi:hypothetical protein
MCPLDRNREAFAQCWKGAGGMSRYMNAARWLLRIAFGGAIVAAFMSLDIDAKLQFAVILVILINFIALDIATSCR